MKISDILWSAANECLADSLSYDIPLRLYSCNAVRMAVDDDDEKAGDCLKFLASLGVNPDSCTEFNSVNPSLRQGARYLWLDFARLVALDEGL